MIRAVSLPPAAGVGALYDSMLQSALRRFFVPILEGEAGITTFFDGERVWDI